MSTILHYQEIQNPYSWMTVNKCLSFRKKKRDGEGRWRKRKNFCDSAFIIGIYVED
jgi:hypothetical protein